MSDQQIQVDDLLNALRDQRESALNACANLNAQVSQMKRVIEQQAQLITKQTDELESLRAFKQARHAMDGLKREAEHDEAIRNEVKAAMNGSTVQ